MGLMPSNLIAAADNPGRKMFPNLARHTEGLSDDDKLHIFIRTDAACAAELLAAGIEVRGFEFLRAGSEVPTKICGGLCRWGFSRAWYYWVATGPGIPPDVAEEFHKRHGRECRVEGDCGAPSPLDANEGFAVGTYHIDTQEGLTAFAELLRSIHKPRRAP